MDLHTIDNRPDTYQGPEELRDSAHHINVLIKSADGKISSAIKLCADARDKIQLTGGMLDGSGKRWTFRRWFTVNVQVTHDHQLPYPKVRKLIGVGPVVAQRRAEKAAAAASRQKSTEQVWDNIPTGTNCSLKA